VLVSLRDYQDEKCDIIHKYTPDEARILKKKGELPAKARIGTEMDLTMEEGVDDDLVDFDSTVVAEDAEIDEL